VTDSIIRDPHLTSRLAELGQQFRVDAIRASAAAGSGHPASAMQAADLMAVLLTHHLRCDFADPRGPGNDQLIFSQGHASPLLYAMLKAAGAITDEELLSYRKAGSRLEGHPTPGLPWADVATGSLGQGLPVGVGLAMAGRYLDRQPFRTWVLCGDSELAEGSMWEAFEHASFMELDNLTAIIDVSRPGQRGPARHGWDTAAYAARLRAFGWHAIETDGHDVTAIDRAYAEAERTAGRPTAIVAHTRKGRGVAAVADADGAHGKPLAGQQQATRELGGPRDLRVRVQLPQHAERQDPPRPGVPRLPRYTPGDEVATWTAFGEALAAVAAAWPDVVALDGEAGDSARTPAVADEFPDRFFEFYIAEQQMIAAAVGMQIRGWLPYAATFAAFLTRAYDFIRMAAVGRASLRIAGSHAGVAIGEDGPSQMSLEDLAALRAVHGSTVLYPCDANQAAWLTAAMASRPGVSYLRTTRGDTPVIYGPDEEFPVGGSRVLESSADDQVTIVAAGVTVHEGLRAARRLAAEGIRARVIDLYSVKPADAATLRAAARATGRVLTAEDHWPEGGLGDAVLDALAGGGAPPPVVRKLAVREMPGSATPAEQLAMAGIDAAAITAAAIDLISSAGASS
jgi:transketolase